MQVADCQYRWRRRRSGADTWSHLRPAIEGRPQKRKHRVGHLGVLVGQVVRDEREMLSDVSYRHVARLMFIAMAYQNAGLTQTPVALPQSLTTGIDCARCWRIVIPQDGQASMARSGCSLIAP